MSLFRQRYENHTGGVGGHLWTRTPRLSLRGLLSLEDVLDLAPFEVSLQETIINNKDQMRIPPRCTLR